MKNKNKINIVIDYETEKRFRQAVSRHMGYKKGNISQAVEEAMELWIKAKDQSAAVPSAGKTRISWT